MYAVASTRSAGYSVDAGHEPAGTILVAAPVVAMASLVVSHQARPA